MKKVFTISFLLIVFNLILSAQNSTVSIPVVEGVAGAEMLIPVNVSSKIEDATSVTLKIEFNQSVATYLSVENSVLGGSFYQTKMISDNVLLVSWSTTNPIDLENKILDVKVKYNSGSTDFKFVSNTNISNVDIGKLPVDFVDGKITGDAAKLELEKKSGKVGDEIEVNLSGSQLVNVGAMGLNIDLDVEAVEFIEIGETNLAGFLANVVDGQLKLSMANINGFNHASGTIVSLKFNVLTDIGSELAFNATSVVTDVSNNNLDIIYTDGSIDILSGPVFTKVMPDTTVDAEETLEFTYEAENVGEDAFTFTLVSGPSNASINETSGVFSWTTSFNDDETNTIVVGLSVAGNVETTHTTVVTINKPDQTPQFTKVMPAGAVAADTKHEFQYEGSQPQNKPLEFALASGPDGATVSMDGLFEWTPTYDDADFNTIIVSLTSVGITVYDTTSISVLKLNRAPVITKKMPADTTIEVNSWPVNISFQYMAEDPDGDIVEFSIVDAPGNAAINSSGTFTFAPEPQKEIGKYNYEIKIIASDGELSDESNTTIILDVLVDVSDNGGLLPTEYTLEQNYPNPFNPTSTIQFALPKQSDVKLEVVNMLGQTVSTLVNSQIAAGIHTVNFNATDFSSGIYLYKLTATALDGSKSFNSIKKMVLMK